MITKKEEDIDDYSNKMQRKVRRKPIERQEKRVKER